MILNINDLTFKYNSHNVLNNINFSVEKGEILAILGPNGVGKTTLLKCINSILKRDKGDVYINDKDTLNMNVTEIAKQMSYVAQNNDTAKLTAFDAILLGRRPHIKWRVSKDDIKKVDAVIKRLNLEHLSLKYIDQMSGGELQKVSIARAFVQETDLFLLDEPTSNLDLKNQAEILGLVKRVVKEHNVSAVMTMHDLNTALRYSDKYLFLQNGSIYGAGDIKEISCLMVESVYGIPVEILQHNGYPVIIPGELTNAA
ncbi:MAG: ABC transporter ATP-binding protein [Desulfobacterales bacterium]|nr:ABC transporter ATP-binding protein [Desulfobacterales bacterium]